MTEISAGQVKELRELTGLGMMECKKALVEAGGDPRKAEELLRIKSGVKASRAAGRIAAEGVIGAYLSPDAKLGALVELNCETDFVAKNEDFLAFAGAAAKLVAEGRPADPAALGAMRLDGTALEQRRQALVQKIGENISFRRFARIEAAAKLALYLHGTRIGVLVEFDGPEEVGKDLAMHIAFARPRYLNQAEVPAEVVARERDIATARAKDSGKPPEIVARMVAGSVNKFLGEVTLLGQPFVKDDKQSVEKILAASKTRVLGYKFLVLSEGSENKKAA